MHVVLQNNTNVNKEIYKHVDQLLNASEQWPFKFSFELVKQQY